MYYLVPIHLCFADFRIISLRIQLWLLHRPSYCGKMCGSRTLIVSLYPVCPILKEKFRGSGCLKFSIMCLDSLRQCTHYGYPAERPPVAPCSRRVKLKIPQQTSPLLSYQSLAAFLGSSKYFLSTEEKYPLANKILPCLE